ncbi:LpqB family beta-propeller domain-containing protein [Blastococcus haudaquaticus]|uniref:Sporulation and spore germination n=1 Tax=Blastococcus haudaquaticus TaxID=1938745 RepID=A0A286GDV7_9ACTN|nr:LpqB family beta-propeller domain-containing protein [Blastococcus haudaquaticus]SOD93687.1 Sporulation and spore germination [Blastococcus haudaquaticus]
MTGVRRFVVLALALLVSGCSTVPMNSSTVQITQAPARPAEVVGIEPLPPEPGATPEEVVRSFIDAAASVRPGHPVARDHLAPEAGRTWSDEAGITVISPDYATVTTETGAVEVTANPVGTIDDRGSFVVGGAATFTRQFTVVQVEDEWRITDPPDGLIILEPDFQRLYEEAAVYFLDETGQRLVPDPRYVVAGEALPTALVDRLLAGPSAPLAAGVRNPLNGARLRSAVTLADQAAVVDLTGLAAEPSPALSAISAQLVWTLTQLGNVTIRSVEVRIDGEPVDIADVPDVQTRGDWAGFDPEAVPLASTGHYLYAGGVYTVTAGQPTPGPAGQAAYGLGDAAVSIDDATGEPSFLVGIRSDASGATLLAGPYDGELATVLTAERLSSPSTAATRSEVWVVRDGTSVVRLQAGGSPQPVTTPTLQGLGVTRVLRLSPDGARAALVVEGSGLYVGTVVRAEDGSVALRDFRAIAPDLTRVVDVAWRDSGSLLVLAGDPGEDRIVPWSVGVDGWGLTELPTAGLPSQPRSIAAAPNRQPLVDAGGTIWQLFGGTWATLVRGQEPLPGTAPFYPL